MEPTVITANAADINITFLHASHLAACCSSGQFVKPPANCSVVRSLKSDDGEAVTSEFVLDLEGEVDSDFLLALRNTPHFQFQSDSFRGHEQTIGPVWFEKYQALVALELSPPARLSREVNGYDVWDACFGQAKLDVVVEVEREVRGYALDCDGEVAKAALDVWILVMSHLGLTVYAADELRLHFHNALTASGVQAGSTVLDRLWSESYTNMEETTSPDRVLNVLYLESCLRLEQFAVDAFGELWPAPFYGMYTGGEDCWQTAADLESLAETVRLRKKQLGAVGWEDMMYTFDFS